jgi:hypothetical protein
LNDFAAAAHVLATDPNGSAAGTYTPLGGVPVTVRVMPWQQEEVVAFGGVRMAAPGRGFKVLQADVPVRPKTHDTLLVDGRSYRIKRDALGDLEGTEWALDVDGGTQ